LTSGPLPEQYAAQKSDMASAAIRLWQMIIDDGQNREMVSRAKQRIPVLRELQSEDSR